MQCYQISPVPRHCSYPPLPQYHRNTILFILNFRVPSGPLWEHVTQSSQRRPQVPQAFFIFSWWPRSEVEPISTTTLCWFLISEVIVLSETHWLFLHHLESFRSYFSQVMVRMLVFLLTLISWWPESPGVIINDMSKDNLSSGYINTQFSLHINQCTVLGQPRFLQYFKIACVAWLMISTSVWPITSPAEQNLAAINCSSDHCGPLLASSLKISSILSVLKLTSFDTRISFEKRTYCYSPTNLFNWNHFTLRFHESHLPTFSSKSSFDTCFQ